MPITRRETLGISASNAEPHYLFNRNGFASNISELLSAFRSRYPNFDIAYSFKTNYLKAACEEVKSHGCYAEVVSPYEYDYAKMIGFPERRIIFNGVIPSEKKFDALKAGGIVNVDNLQEYIMIEDLACKADIPVGVGVRVNFPLSGGQKSRFGIDVNGPEFDEIMCRAKYSRYAKVVGFHHHIHGARYVRYWTERAAKMIELAKEYGASYLDLGGGMWGKMPESLLGQFAERPNTYEEYGDAVGSLFADSFPENDVKLIVEPGIGLVGSEMSCVSHVVGIKWIDGTPFVQLDINGAATAFDYNCDANRITKPLTVYHTGKEAPFHLEGACLVGTTCIETDVLVRGYTGDLAVGDTIVFENIGAYSLVTSRQFITPRLGVYESDTGECLRIPENIVDMFGKYLLIE